MSCRRIRPGAVLAAIAALLFLLPLRLSALPDGQVEGESLEYQVKAKFLFSFAKFVDWPGHKFSQPDSPFIIGVVGTDPFGGLLEEAAQDERINDHTVLILHIDSMQELRKCHMIFVCRSEDGRVGSILSEVRSDNVLTVGDTDKFAARGGMINFVMADNAVRFEINEAAAKHAGLKISSKLLQLALPVAAQH